MRDKHHITEERNDAKVSRSVLESSGSRERVTDFNIKGDTNRKRSGKPRFKGRNRYRTFAYQRVKPDCIQGNRIELPKLGKIKFIQHRPVPNGFTIKRALATLKADGWYVTLTLEDASVPD